MKTRAQGLNSLLESDRPEVTQPDAADEELSRLLHDVIDDGVSADIAWNSPFRSETTPKLLDTILAQKVAVENALPCRRSDVGHHSWIIKFKFSDLYEMFLSRLQSLPATLELAKRMPDSIGGK